ncbi:MAG: glycosyltransferase family 2 protein [Bacteroidales bacterium]|nr:glycosyltransferase family 2 protein [Bacteroidales bacterium]
MFSVIIPTYNGAELLRQSLPTWFSQTLPEEEFEVIVVDNRSTDDTKQAVEAMILGRDNFRYLYEPQPGATAARHGGARVAKGDILVFADNDGLFNPECLERIQEVYERNPECEAVTGRIEILWDGEEPDWIAPYKFMLGQLDYGSDIKYGYEIYLNGGLMSVKKTTFERLHGFNPDLVGDYLIGDGDTGFVRKMFEDHCLIGYTPFAVMQHMQKVAKHGSEKGIARHFFNNGTAEAYALFRKNGFRMTKDVKEFKMGQTMALIKKSFQFYVLGQKDRDVYFSLQQRRGALRFFKYLKNPELAQKIKVEDVY